MSTNCSSWLPPGHWPPPPPARSTAQALREGSAVGDPPDAGVIQMIYSDKITGPWKQHPGVILEPVALDKWDSFVTNPSIYFYPNGTALLAYRGGPCDLNWPNSTHGHLYPEKWCNSEFEPFLYCIYMPEIDRSLSNCRTPDRDRNVRLVGQAVQAHREIVILFLARNRNLQYRSTKSHHRKVSLAVQPVMPVSNSSFYLA